MAPSNRLKSTITSNAVNRMTRFFGAVLLLSALAGAARAQPSERVASTGGWRMPGDRGACIARATYANGVTVMVRYDRGRDDTVFFFANPAWREIGAGVTYAVAIHFDNDSTWRDVTSRGLRLDRSAGRLTGVAATFAGDDIVEDFALARSVAVSVGGRRVDNLSLRGTRAVADRLLRCAAESRGHRDPFAEAAAASEVAVRARLLIPLNAFIADSDYPAAALRNEEEGNTRFRLTVGEDGRVIGCTVIGSSGSQSLDSAACSIMQRRARFAPARTRNGSPTVDTYVSGISWRIRDSSVR